MPGARDTPNRGRRRYMQNLKINRIAPFGEWLRDRKINEGVNPDTNVKDRHRQNNVYGFTEYTELLQEAYKLVFC